MPARAASRLWRVTRASRRLWAAAAMAAVVSLCGCAHPRRARPTARPSTSTTQASGREVAAPAPPAGDYGGISARNLFHPLVVAPKGGEKAAAAGAAKTGSGQSGGTTVRPKPPPGTMAPPDPTADLALTGITEDALGLCVLVERMSTGEGHYARIGDTVFGFTVDRIGPGWVILRLARRTYELKLGQKETKTHYAAAPPPSASPPGGPGGPGGPGAAPQGSGPPGGDESGDSGGNDETSDEE